MRRAELLGLRVDDVDFDHVAIVVGKGRRPRACPFGNKTGLALSRYLRLRGAHPFAAEEALWLGKKGPLTETGLTQMLWRRSEQARIGKVHPHQFRHTFAHTWLAQGGGEGDLVRLTGWTGRDMLARYAASPPTSGLERRTAAWVPTTACSHRHRCRARRALADLNANRLK
jgi:integrase